MSGGGSHQRLAISRPQLPFLSLLLHLVDVGGEQRLQGGNQSGEGLKVAEAYLRRQEMKTRPGGTLPRWTVTEADKPACGRRRCRRGW